MTRFYRRYDKTNRCFYGSPYIYREKNDYDTNFMQYLVPDSQMRGLVLAFFLRHFLLLSDSLLWLSPLSIWTTMNFKAICYILNSIHDRTCRPTKVQYNIFILVLEMFLCVLVLCLKTNFQNEKNIWKIFTHK